MTASVDPLAVPAEEDVRMLLEEVWSSFLGTEEPVLPAARTPYDIGWSATVAISGGWAGMVDIELPVAAAEEVAHRMLGLADDERVTDEDVADAVGELVNMIGGNVKSLMPGPSELSLPVVAAGRVARSSDTLEACHLDAVWAGHPLTVHVSVTPGGPR